MWPSGKTLGGSSVLNAQLYVRGSRKIFDRWAAEGAEGWSYKDVLPYFKKLEDNRDPEYVANGKQIIQKSPTLCFEINCFFLILSTFNVEIKRYSRVSLFIKMTICGQ